MKPYKLHHSQLTTTKFRDIHLTNKSPHSDPLSHSKTQYNKLCSPSKQTTYRPFQSTTMYSIRICPQHRSLRLRRIATEVHLKSCHPVQTFTNALNTAPQPQLLSAKLGSELHTISHGVTINQHPVQRTQPRWIRIIRYSFHL